MARYNFSIHPKVRVGRLIGLSFFTGYFGNDTDAIAMKTWLEVALADYAKVSVSKVISEAASNEIPATHTITDTEDWTVVLTDSEDTSKRVVATLPGLNADAEINWSGLENVGLLDSSGNSVNKIVTLRS